MPDRRPHASVLPCGHVALVLLSLVLASPTPHAEAATAEALLAPVGSNDGAQLGLFVADAGDLDGDGQPDFVVGAPGARLDGMATGQAWIYLGGPDLDDAPDLMLSGESSGDQFGTSVRGCGDVDGDGWDDLVVGAPRNDAAGSNAGRAYVYFGGPDLDDQPDLILNGLAAGSLFGYSVAGAGNLDGQGEGIIVGAPFSEGSAGRAHVYLGGPGLDATADLTLAGAATGYFGWAVHSAGDFDGDGWDDVFVGGNTLANVYLFAGGPGLDDQPDLLFSGDAGSNRFGYGLAPAGDVNGDGWDDVIIGDMHHSAGGTYAGRAHVYFGGPDADGLAELAYTGTHERGIFGRTVAGGRDLDGDGLDDLVIGAPNPDVAGYGPGQTFVFFGGDLPGTSKADTLADIVLTGEAESDRLGAQVALVGDQDGDGRADFITGADFFDPPTLINAGKFYLYRVAGLPPTAAPDSFLTDEDMPLVVAAPGVLTNDHEPDGLTLTAALAEPPAHGSVSLADDGSFTYTPEADFFGDDTFTYVATSGSGASAPVPVSLTIAPVNDAPLALDDAATTPQDSTVVIAVLDNDLDIDGTLAPASLLVTAGPASGLVEADTIAGTLAYTPAAGFAGNDTLAYTVADDQGTVSAPALVFITVVDIVPPTAIASLDASPGPGLINVSWAGVPADATTVELWRALWRDGDGASAYPLYDDAPGSTPPTRPASRNAALADSQWTLVATVEPASGSIADTLAVRGVYHYEAFATDADGNWSAPTGTAPRATSYRLGDLTEPPDGTVDLADVVLLSQSFGTASGDAAFIAAHDLGPTDNASGTGVPLTDGLIDFDDVMIVGQTFGEPVAPPAPGGPVHLEWRLESLTVWSLHLLAPSNDLKGLRVALALPDDVTVAVEAGALLSAQPTTVFLQNAAPERLDLALVVLGGGRGLVGVGELLRLTTSDFLSVEAAELTARDAANAGLPIEPLITTDAPAAAPAFTLAQNAPNPFNPVTRISFAVPTAGRVRLTVFDVRGHRVARLLDTPLEAGHHTATWQGDDDDGRAVASGIYLYRLEAAGAVQTKQMTIIK